MFALDNMLPHVGVEQLHVCEGGPTQEACGQYPLTAHRVQEMWVLRHGRRETEESAGERKRERDREREGESLKEREQDIHTSDR